jgi:uncharacterized protein YbjT (DUF2867 family)
MRVIVFGGNGFVGEAVCKELRDYTVVTFGSSHDENILTADLPIRKDDIVINLIALTPLKKPKGTTYHEVHVKGLKRILKSSTNVKRFIQMSALGADTNSENEYLRTKGLAEELITQSGLDYTIFRPSLMYDIDNEFINMLRKLAWTRVFPNIKTKMQPVFRGDIAKLIHLAVKGKIHEKIVEVGGPDTFTVFEIAKKIYKRLGKRCFGIPALFVPKMPDNMTGSNVAEKYVKLKIFDDWLENVFIV